MTAGIDRRLARLEDDRIAEALARFRQEWATGMRRKPRLHTGGEAARQRYATERARAEEYRAAYPEEVNRRLDAARAAFLVLIDPTAPLPAVARAATTLGAELSLPADAAPYVALDAITAELPHWRAEADAMIQETTPWA